MKSRSETREQLERAATILRRSRSFWRRAVVVLSIGIAIAVPYVLTRTPAYRSETVILYQETIRSTDLMGGEGSTESARRVGARLREVLFSRGSLEPIIAELHLSSGHGRPLDRAAQLDAVEDMRKHITFRAREGDAFEIAFVGSTPAQAQEVTRRLGECIIQEAASRRAEHAKALKEFLAAEDERNKADLQHHEAELARFTALHPEVAARLQGGPLARVGGEPSAGGRSALDARAHQIQRRLRAAETRRGQPSTPPPKFKPPPDSAELIAARKALADKLVRYTDKHPDVSDARAQLRVAEAAQAAAVAAAYDAFVASEAAALDDPPPPKDAAEEAALRRQLANVYAEMSSRGDAGATAAPVTATDPEVALEVELRRLQREVNEGRERQHQLDEKLFKASITANSVMNDRNIQVSVLDPAFLPSSPVSKPRSYLLAGLIALSIALAFAAAIVSAVADDRIHDRSDVDRLDVMPFMVVIPRPQLAAERCPSIGQRAT